MVDAGDVVAVGDEPVLARVELVEIVRAERDVVHEVRQPQAGRDRRIEVTERAVFVVQIPQREELAVAGVVEQVARPTGLEEGDDVDLDELEAHRLGVEPVARIEVTGRDRNVVECHPESLPRCGAMVSPESPSPIRSIPRPSTPTRSPNSAVGTTKRSPPACASPRR